ncbi:MAG: benzoyl-CoA reductase subunit D [Polyangiaceae bacterium]|nr:benzoyl-CoA reductase subunit D [Polyangiaceae bacterium]
MIVATGIDVGTSAIKVVVVESTPGSGREREGARVLAKAEGRVRRRDQRQVIQSTYDEALEGAKKKPTEVDYVATTGEGEMVEFRVGHFYGMTAHARGALFLDPEVRAVLDVGALHARAIKLDERSKVLGYRMTSQCASGSGQFLENISRYLGVTLDEIGPLSLTGGEPEKISGVCAVLAETDVINMVSRGITVPNILKGIHESMAVRFAKLLRGIDAEGTVMVTGGLAADVGLLASLKEQCKKHKLEKAALRTHEDAVFAGAIGAALWGSYRFEKLRGRAAA